MINWALVKREMKASLMLLLILMVVLTLYISIIISMYEPELSKLLDGYVEMMPGLMAAVGMKAGATTLIGFMCNYLYGFILVVFPMLFCMIRANGLVAKYVESGTMVSLLAAPVKRKTVAFTQMLVLLCGIILLVVYTTIVEIVCAGAFFPGELEPSAVIRLNLGLFCLIAFVGGFCFLTSCACSETKYSLGIGIGLPLGMYVVKMIANMGESASVAKYFTFFSLFQPESLAAAENGAILGVVVLLAGAVCLYGAGITVFARKDLHI